MVVTHKSEFIKGLFLAVTFFVVLAIMFSPYFGQDRAGKGMNALEASDQLFNSISKGSTNYFPALAKKAQTVQDKTYDVTLKMKDADIAGKAAKILTAAKAQVKEDGAQLKASGKVGDLLSAALADSEVLFKNQTEELGKKYGIAGTGYTRSAHDGVREGTPGEVVVFTWSSLLGNMDKALKEQKNFAEAAVISEIVKKGTDVAYNFFGIEAQTIGTKIGVVTFSLIFYVVYTLWWGIAILFLFEGVGLQMKAGAKKEV